MAILAGLLRGQATNPSREYIHLGGRVIAIENAVGVTVAPASVRLRASQSTTFSATGGTVVWSLSPATGSGAITSGGVFTAPGSIAAEASVTVEARQSAGGTILASAVVVLEPASLTVAPASINLQASGIQDFTANMATIWAINPAVGTLTQNASGAHYQAPASVAGTQTVTLTATSTGNPAMSGTATAVLLPASGQCIVSPTSVSWPATGSTQTVTLSNCPTGYHWTASSGGAPWVTLGGSGGIGNGSITLTAGNLSGGVTRTGTVTIDGTAVVVRQDPNCTLTIPNQVLGSPSASIAGSVTCGVGVAWTSSPGGATWLRLSPASGTGPTAVTLQVDRYLAAQGSTVRSATITAQAASLTVSQHPECSLSPAGVSLRGGADWASVQLTCPTLAPWIATPGAGWVTASPATGSGSTTITVSATANGTGNVRTSTVAVDAKSIAVSQAVTSVVTVTPETQTLSAGQGFQFVGLIGATEQTNQLTWTVSGGPGSFPSNPGNYQAPAVVLPTDNTAQIQAADPLGGGSDTATITLIPYVPAQDISVAPTTGNALTQSFQFRVVNATGVTTTEVNALISSSINEYQNACSIMVWPGGTVPFQNSIKLQENTGSNFMGPISAGTAGSLENSQCRVVTGSSSVTTNGNELFITLQVEFKPGFIGAKVVALSTLNSTGASTAMAALGTWDLSANPASLAPNVTITSPSAGATVGGMSVEVKGWALDNITRAENVITNVRVYVDNVLQAAPVSMNQASTICTTYPNRPGCPNVGWLFSWDSRGVSNGPHTLKVEVTDFDNPAKTSSASVAVTVYNPPSTPITVSPASAMARMYLGGLYNPPLPQFTANRGAVVVNPVNWSLQPSSMTGSISGSGAYTPPIPGYQAAGYQLQVFAANPSDSNDKGYSWVTLVGVLGNGYNLMYLSPGQTAQYLSSLGSVTYSLSPNLGSITYYGLYTQNAGSYTPGTIVKVTATSTANPNNQETAYVQLQ